MKKALWMIWNLGEQSQFEERWCEAVDKVTRGATWSISGLFLAIAVLAIERLLK